MANRAYRVVISVEANKMFDEHIKFLAQVSTKAAHSLSNELLTRLKVLGTSPYLYPVFFSEKIKTTYRKLIFKRYLVLYSVNEEEKVVKVEYIWDMRKNNGI